MLDINTAKLVKEAFDREIIGGTCHTVEEFMKMEPIASRIFNAYHIYGVQVESETYLARLQLGEENTIIVTEVHYLSW